MTNCGSGNDLLWCLDVTHICDGSRYLDASSWDTTTQITKIVPEPRQVLALCSPNYEISYSVFLAAVMNILQWIAGCVSPDPPYFNKFNDMVSTSLALGISDVLVRQGFQDLRKQIDDDLGQSPQATSLFRRCNLLALRNVLAPISSLPAELLSDIFRFNVDDDNFDHDSPATGTNGIAPTLKTVTHVCSYWRQVALGSPCLWIEVLNFVDEHPGWTLATLRRSGGLPFELHADFKHRWCSDFRNPTTNVTLGLHFISRVHSLHLHATSPAFDRLVKAMKGGAPVLESLSLLYDDDVGTVCQLPQSIFDGCTPVLRRLTLQNCKVAWTAPIFQWLTHLHITYPSVGITVRPPMSGLYSVLQALPFLQKLGLRNVVSAFDAESTVSLNHLMYLEITGIAKDVSSFIHLLLFRQTVVLRVHCVRSSPDDIATTLDVIGSRMRGLRIREEAIRMLQGDIIFCGWETCGNVDISSLSRSYVTRAHRSASIHVSMTWDEYLHPIEPSILSQLVSPTFRLVAPKTVENLVFELDPGLMPPPSVLEATLRPFARVIELRLESSLPPGLLTAMEFMPLHMLIISQIYFSPAEGVDYESLFHFLQRRLVVHERTLSYLRLLDCWDVTDDQFAALQALVSCVTLDCNPPLEEIVEYETDTDIE